MKTFDSGSEFGATMTYYSDSPFSGEGGEAVGGIVFRKLLGKEKFTPPRRLSIVPSSTRLRVTPEASRV